MSAMYGYDPNTDYQALINEAVKNKDFARAAIYEQQRNEKIAGEGMTGVQGSSLYTHYLPGSYQGGYTNPYQGMIDEAIGRLTDTSAFKKAYLREADRTMEDTLAQYGTMTGGIPSTQAVAAASQGADYQKSKLAETLQQQQAQNVNLLLSAGQAAASDYQARISEALTRWNQLGYADDQVSQILGVAIGTPTTDQSYLNWQQGQQDKSDAYTMAMTMLQTGQMPSADVLAAAGITAEDAQALASQISFNNNREAAYTMAMTMLQTGQMPSADVLAAAGITAEDAQALASQMGFNNNWEAAYTLAMTMLQAGQMPSADVLAAAGISAEDAAALQQAYTPVYYGGGSGDDGNPTSIDWGKWTENQRKAMYELARTAMTTGDWSEFDSQMDTYQALGYDPEVLYLWLHQNGIATEPSTDEPPSGYQGSTAAGNRSGQNIPTAERWLYN